MASPGMWQSDRRLYVNKAGDKVVAEDAPDVFRVLVAESGEILLSEAVRLGLVKVKEGTVTNVEPEKVETVPDAEPEPEPETEPALTVPEPERVVPEPELEPSKAQEPNPNKARSKSEDK